MSPSSRHCSLPALDSAPPLGPGRAVAAFLITSLALVGVSLPAAESAAQSQEARQPSREPRVWIEYYDQRYGLHDVFEKGTDNTGGGLEELYGTRNFRVILKGVAYRGGANNKWHRTEPRGNQTPLPDDGLENLCEEGFGRAYYLYETNFESAPELTTCESPHGPDHALSYFQVSSTDEAQTYEVLQAVYETIQDYRHGPLYIHCWNGWHASGLLAAKILRQFCGYSAEEAVEYWDRNTDGNNQERRYESIRRRIREFAPYPEFRITDEEAALICPRGPEISPSPPRIVPASPRSERGRSGDSPG